MLSAAQTAGQPDLVTVIYIVIGAMGVIIVPALGYLIRTSLTQIKLTQEALQRANETLAVVVERIASIQHLVDRHERDLSQLFRQTRAPLRGRDDND